MKITPRMQNTTRSKAVPRPQYEPETLLLHKLVHGGRKRNFDGFHVVQIQAEDLRSGKPDDEALEGEFFYDYHLQLQDQSKP
jgi:hypothetical protein